MNKFPDRTNDIKMLLMQLKQAESVKDEERARQIYRPLIELVKQQSINEDGRLDELHNELKLKYSNLVKSDPAYIQLCNLVIPMIQKNQGIVQTSFYKLFPNLTVDQLRYVLYFAADHGKIRRDKKGNSYALYVL